MKKILSFIIITVITLASLPFSVRAAGGIYASGGGAKTVGQSFTVTVTASGATFNAFEGTISVSGPVTVSSFSAGSATWLTQPANGVHFKGIVTTSTSSLTIASVKLKTTAVGNGAVTVSSVRLANAGSEVGSGAGSASFSVTKAPTPPGAVEVSSSSHPDQNTAYEATTVALSWSKASGVTAFSYLLDQTANTTPAAKATSSDTSVSYADKAVGQYFFHIRAQNADGWGATSHFTINIKEPDPKINESLSKPTNIKIEKDANFINDVELGLVTGIVISGQTEPNFDALITLTPTPTLPEGKTLTAKADLEGKFFLTLDYPIISGFKILTIQGQNEKILTPVSDPIYFEISQAEGGSIHILTKEDQRAREIFANPIAKESILQKKFSLMNYLIVTLALVILVLIVIESVKYFKRRQLKKAFNK